MAKEYARVRISDINVPERRLRATQRDSVKQLASGMKEVGQLQPILLNRLSDGSLELVAGLHRYLASQENGEEYIDADVQEMDATRAEIVEIQENLYRAELHAIERAEHLSRHMALTKKTGARRKRGRPKKEETPKDPRDLVALSLDVNSAKSADFSEATRVKTVPEMAKELGVSERTMYKDARIADKLHPKVRDLIKLSPYLRDNQRELERLGRRSVLEQVRAVSVILTREANGERVNGIRDALRWAERKKNAHLAEKSEWPTGGPYRTIVVDPPWAGSDSGDVDPFGNLAPAYQTMSVEEMKELPVGELAFEDDCHLYLWTTGRTWHHALELVQAWGFRFVQTLVWVKHRQGTGKYFAHKHELVLFAMRGTRDLARAGVPDVFHGERTKHSVKPDQFYALVKSVSPGPRIELFQRTPREGFDGWGAETRKEAV